MTLRDPSDLIQGRKLINVYDSLTFSGTSAKTGANAPTWSTASIGWTFSHNPPSNQEIQYYGVSPSQWREGTAFHIALNWFLTSDGAATEDVKWDLLYRGIGSQDATWPTAFTTLEETVDVSSYVTRQNIHTEFSDISGSGLGYHTQFDFKIQRDTADAADDHPHDVILKSFEVHFLTDAFGSVGHDSKWGAN